MPQSATSAKGVCKVLQSSREIGLLGEDIAARHLKALGFSIVCKNFRSRFGEIDLIAKDGDTIVFVEVKARRNQSFGRAIEQVNKAKQRKIMKVACAYLASTGDYASEVRFDVLAIDMLPGGVKRVELIRGAFDRWR